MLQPETVFGPPCPDLLTVTALIGTCQVHFSHPQTCRIYFGNLGHLSHN